MDTGSWFVQRNAWQVMALGRVFFSALHTLGGWGMSGLTRTLARRGIGRPLDTCAMT